MIAFRAFTRITVPFVAFLAVLASLAFTVAPALAAAPAPEEPTTGSAQSITATSAIFEGVLNPHSKALVGGYFAYSEPNGITCAEGPTAGLEGFEGEQEVEAQAVHTTVGLQPSRKYKFCLVAYVEEGAQATPGQEVTVETKPAPPTILSESVPAAKATEATLDATINPNNQETKYQFEYSEKATGEKLEGTIVKVPSAAGTIAEAFEEHVVEAPTEVLLPGTTYYYRVLAENAKGEKAAPGKVKSFLTGPPETPVEAKVKADSTTAVSVEVEGTLNPGKVGEPGSTYEFLYNAGGSCEGGKAAPEPAGVAQGLKKERVSAQISGLQPNAEYTFCLIASNAAGEKTSAAAEPVTFFTHAAAPTISEEAATKVTQTTATVKAKVNPEGLETHVYLEYGEGRTTAPLNIGAVVGEQEVSFALKGLTANTSYPFHVVAFNSQESVNGTGASFKTLAPPIAHGETPWWGISSGARPTALQPGSGANEVQSITVAKPESPQVILGHRPGGGGSFGVALPANATAAELQVKLEEGKDFGAGSVTVTGTGPGGGSPFTVAFRGALASQAVPLFTAFSGATFSVVVAGHADGQVDVIATNLGDGDASGVEAPVRVEDVLPAGFRAVGVEGSTAGVWQSGLHREGLACEALSEVRVVCTFAGVVHPFEAVEVRIPVVLKAGVASGEENMVDVSGGGALAGRSVSRALQVGGLAVFGVEENTLAAEEAGGGVDAQAGSHPFQVTNTLTFNHGPYTPGEPSGDVFPVALPKDASVLVPAGLIGNPTSIAQCTDQEFLAPPHQPNSCPLGSIVGVASVTLDEPSFAHLHVSVSPIFNLTPEAGEPARFGFEADGTVPVLLDAAVRTGKDYGVTISSHNISELPGVLSSSITLWGVPGDARHDAQRGVACLVQTGASCPLGEATPPPLLSMPTSCASPLQASAEVDSWADPTETIDFGQSEAMPAMDGCNRLSFDPSIQVTPDGTAGSSPMGVNVDVHVPQTAALNPEGLAESAVRNITVALPEGVAVNPAGGDGLQGCSESQVGFTGFAELEPGVRTATFTAKLPEPLQPGINFCPDGSKIGTVKIKTPFLPNPVEGAVYLASQNENPFGSLLALYLVAEDPVSGVLVKLAGEVHLTAAGQIVTTFENSPQAPFEDAELHFFGGERAPLSSPARCGSYTTTSAIAPWSGGPASEPQSTFNITSGPNGSACPGASLPFAPSLTGGSTNINAAAFSPLTTTIAREDGNQNMAAVKLHFPPGLSGLLSGVKLCGESEANTGTCTAASLIGETTVSAGVGSALASVTGGKVYITGAYHGAPFGLSIVNPVKTGPFDLEHDTANPNQTPACDCIVVRAKIEVDPHTAALTITTNNESEGYAIPHLIDGIPVQIKKVNVLINRPGFTFNPTDCNPQAITGSITSDEGASSPVSVPFQATNCAILKFAPKFTVSTSGKTSRSKGASLTAKVTYPNAAQGTQANITRVKVDLPKQLPSRLTTLQKACTNAQFEANPANCPAASKIGFAKVTTPLLPVPLEGPAIFVSHGGEAFPSLTIVLQGYGVKVDLIGTTFISKKGITSTTFKTVPDVPFNTFSLTLPEGKYSALAANGNLCKTKLAMPTEFLAQNGAKINESTKIAVTGCKKAHKATKKKSKHKNKKAKSHKGGKR